MVGTLREGFGETQAQDEGIGAGRGDATVVAVQVDGARAGTIALADTARPSAAGAVARLKAMGIDSAMVTGDAPGPAEAIARAVGIQGSLGGVDNPRGVATSQAANRAVSARVSPEGKVERVRALRAAGRRVAMVGDGVNDAAALAAADVGVAFATGADVATEAADINLVGSTPHLVADAVDLARASVRLIRQNLAWAFGYNVVAIPLAALGRLPPAWAAGMMMVSSLTVVVNGLRLNRWRGGEG